MQVWACGQTQNVTFGDLFFLPNFLIQVLKTITHLSTINWEKGRASIFALQKLLESSKLQETMNEA